MAVAAVVSSIQGLWRSVIHAARRVMGLPSRRHTEDRRILEQVILPEYATRPEISRILFVGCAAYTQQYGQFFPGREYWTIDPVARRRQYGSSHHIVDTLQNLGNHVAPDYFDLILCNGVLGWGLNTPADADAALTTCYSHLRPGGELLVGWNDISPRNRVAPEDIPALRQFETRPFGSAQLTRWKVAAANHHVFDFYRRPMS